MRFEESQKNGKDLEITAPDKKRLQTNLPPTRESGELDKEIFTSSTNNYSKERN
jgi:hypothetical protein